MNEEIKYCKFCDKEKPIIEFCKSGFAIKNICKECNNKKQTQIYRDSKKVKELQQENARLKDKNNKAFELLQILHYNFPDYDDMHERIEDIQKILKEN